MSAHTTEIPARAIRGASPPARPANAGGASRAKLVTAFAAVYIIWGSTYLAIRHAIETIPPFLMAGTRMLLAGIALYLWARWRGAAGPTRREWRAATIAGALLLLGGNGAVVWAQQRVPSGVTALLVASMPFWMVVLDALRPGGTRPHGRTIGGLVLGMGGIVLLIGPRLSGTGHIDLLGAAALMFGSASWAAGSLYSRDAPLPGARLLSTGMQMLTGGALLMLLALVVGEVGGFDSAGVSVDSAVAYAYLVVFGSLVGFTAFVWLLAHVPADRVATYAYVNPIVAVLLGWAVDREPITPRIAIAAIVIVTAVALIVTTTAPPRPARPAA